MLTQGDFQEDPVLDEGGLSLAFCAKLIAPTKGGEAVFEIFSFFWNKEKIDGDESGHFDWVARVSIDVFFTKQTLVHGQIHPLVLHVLASVEI